MAFSHGGRKQSTGRKIQHRGADLLLRYCVPVNKELNPFISPNGLLKGVPVAAKVAVQDTPRMAAHLRDTQGGNKLVECAGTPLVDSLLEPGKGLLTKSGAGDDVVLMVFQHIEIPEVFDPTAFHKGFQRLLN